MNGKRPPPRDHHQEVNRRRRPDQQPDAPRSGAVDEPRAPDLRLAAGMVAWELRHAPDLGVAGVRVALEREEDPPPPDVVRALGPRAWVPVVAGQLVIGGVQEELALGLVLA